MADWGVFSFTRKPLQHRILLSSLISIPLDSLAFLYLSVLVCGRIVCGAWFQVRPFAGRR